jgi:hypothetical protein
MENWAIVGAVVSSVAAALATIASLMQAQLTMRGVRLQDQDGRVNVLLNVMQRWSDCLKDLYKIRHKAEEFKAAPEKFTDVTEFMASEYWQTLRVVCNFYEFCGLLAYNKILRIETLLVIITVRRSDYEIARPAIERLRKDYRPDIYLFWDWLDMACNTPLATMRLTRKARAAELDAIRKAFGERPGAGIPGAANGANPFDPDEKIGL